MKVYLVHHTQALVEDPPPVRHLSPVGEAQADRLGDRFRALGVAPAKILHSDRLWTVETAGRIAARLGLEDRTAETAYPIQTGDPVAPFLAEVEATDGDVMLCGHIDYLLRTASALVIGDETRKVVEFKPGNGTAVGFERDGEQWFVTFAWRQDHAPG